MFLINSKNEFYVDTNQDQPKVKPEEPLELSEELVSQAEEYDNERVAVAYLTKDLDSGLLESRETRPPINLYMSFHTIKQVIKRQNRRKKNCKYNKGSPKIIHTYKTE